MKRILITCGDPNGIGIEILLKAANIIDLKDRIVFVGKREILSFYSKKLGIPLPSIEVVEVESDFSLNPGKIEKINGKFSALCIEKAVEIARKDHYPIVTLPICKENFRASGYDFEGHTDFLKYLTGSKKTMMMFLSPSFSVVLHTVHIPLNKVPLHVSKDELIDGIQFAYNHTKKLFTGKDVDIYVCGLNPHAGENGYIGKEDFTIKEAVSYLQGKHLPVKGVFPADTLFFRMTGERNIVYAMYHDQGLVAVKTKHPEECVNITLGLPFLRLSVSHGTAFDIAGKGVANYNNLLYVLNTTIRFLKGEI